MPVDNNLPSEADVATNLLHISRDAIRKLRKELHFELNEDFVKDFAEPIRYTRQGIKKMLEHFGVDRDTIHQYLQDDTAKYGEQEEFVEPWVVIQSKTAKRRSRVMVQIEGEPWGAIIDPADFDYLRPGMTVRVRNLDYGRKVCRLCRKHSKPIVKKGRVGRIRVR